MQVFSRRPSHEESSSFSKSLSILMVMTLLFPTPGELFPVLTIFGLASAKKSIGSK